MDKRTYSKPVNVIGKPIEQLYSKEYEDPRDAIYLNAFRAIPGFDKVGKVAIEYGYERAATVSFTGSNIRVTQKNMPYIYDCVNKACEILNLDRVPDVYIQESPFINAFTTGSAHPILVINNSILHRLTHEELMFLIGHEIGHIKSDHVQYALYGQVIQDILNGVLSGIPYIGDLMPTALYLAYQEWNRRSEFTADHAGLLVNQDLPSAITLLAKLGGYPLEFYSCIDANDFLQQALDFEDLDDRAFNRAIKFMSTLDQSHPWCVLRAKELYRWVESGEYARILKRSSGWLEDELSRLMRLTDKASDKHERRKQKVSAAISSAKNTKQALLDHRAEHKDTKGHKKIVAAAQEGILAIQDIVSESSAKKKNESANDSKEQYRKAATLEKELRKLFKETDEAEIEAITIGTLGELTMDRTALQDDCIDKKALLPDVIAGKLETGKRE